MKEVVIVLSDIRDRIRLEDKYNYNANLTIGLADGGDFYLVIKFIDLTLDDFKKLAELSKLSRPLSISSILIDKEEYNVSHIVVLSFAANNGLEITWECLSDDPTLYGNN